METKKLLFTIAFFAVSFFSASAQELLISEDFSSTAWADELARLNPGTSANPNALNPIAYVTPGTTSGSNSYTNLNTTDLYFGKYHLSGAIECLPVLACATGDQINHSFDNNGVPTAVAFRFQNTTAGFIEFPEVSSAGIITIHIRDNNATAITTIGLERYDATSSGWLPVYTFSLAGNGSYTTRDEVLTYDVNSPSPIQLRLINNVASSKKFIDLFRVDIASKSPSAVKTIKAVPFKLIGRRLISEQLTNVSIYNTVGEKVLETSAPGEIELPASLGKGIFLVKSDLGSQKIVLN